MEKLQFAPNVSSQRPGLQRLCFCARSLWVVCMATYVRFTRELIRAWLYFIRELVLRVDWACQMAYWSEILGDPPPIPLILQAYHKISSKGALELWSGRLVKICPLPTQILCLDKWKVSCRRSKECSDCDITEWKVISLIPTVSCMHFLVLLCTIYKFKLNVNKINVKSQSKWDCLNV